ncbi:MAG TPA: type II toxin-antitoxin system RelE/ParE family toxin [Longimicrobium sp.]|nr:type II toxin-antitoxin system RelE/ParE family toxin [Longimicrobium sp.]
MLQLHGAGVGAGYLEFVFLPSFERSAAGLLSDAEIRDLELELLENPQAGAVVAGTGGVRKVRLALPGRGKRGSVRVIYLYVEVRQTIYLLLCYPKNEQENLTPEQKKSIRQLVGKLQGEE